PPHQQQQIRVQLSTTLQGVVTQQLLQTADGQGRVVAAEVLVATPAVRNLVREAKVHQIYSVMQAGGRFGMQTMDSSLAELVRAGKLTHEMAMDRSHDPDELTRLLGSKPQVSESFAMGGAMTGGAAMGSPAMGGGTMGGYSG
ncbi:MAG TPA: type IV pili twitching motility protein PilT, partial [Chloroflexota bacterium]|nr:type IV pili twitching motility protein PilT [Chloroflexota bacterium]